MDEADSSAIGLRSWICGQLKALDSPLKPRRRSQEKRPPKSASERADWMARPAGTLSDVDGVSGDDHIARIARATDRPPRSRDGTRRGSQRTVESLSVQSTTLTMSSCTTRAVPRRAAGAVRRRALDHQGKAVK
jgi:hypothetical protein